MNWKSEVFENFKLMAVTDLKSADPKLLERVEAAYQGGVDIVQLRSKVLTDRAIYDLGLGIRAIADRCRKLFFVNDRLDLALAVSADGIHVGQEDFPVALIRKVAMAARTNLWIGKSTHRFEEACRAKDEGADYFSVGPVFSTPTKPGVAAVGLSLVHQVSETFDMPFVAIGGIDASNMGKVLESGARRIAVVRAVFEAEDVYEAAKKLRSEIEKP